MKIVKSLTMFIIVLMLVVSLPLGAFADVVPYLDTTDVMEDLAGLSVDGVAFNEADYPLSGFNSYDMYWRPSEGGKVIGIYERGRGTEDHALYIYVYHPSVSDKFEHDNSSFLCDIDCYSESLSGDLYHFTDIPAILLDHSDDHRFLKIKVELSDLVIGTSIPSSNYCIYSASVRFSGTLDDPSAYTYEPWYHCSLNVEIDGMEVSFYFDKSGGLFYRQSSILELNVNHSIYYTNTSPKGDNYRQALYTAYFSVPELYFDDNFKLTSLRCSWEEGHTTPRVMTDDADLYEHLKKLADYDGALDGSNVSLGSVFANARYTNYDVWFQQYKYDFYFSSSINAPKTYEKLNDAYISNAFCKVDNYPDVSKRNYSVFNNAFLVDDLDDFYIGYNSRFSGYTGYIEASSKKVSLFDAVDEGCLKGTNVYEVSNWDMLDLNGRFDDNCWYHGIVTLFVDDDEDRDVRQLITIDPSEIETLSDDVIINYYFIGEHYIDEFRTACSAAAEAGERMVLLRYAVRDYYSGPALYVNTGSYQLDLLNIVVVPVVVLPSNCNLSWGTAFQGFQVIDVTFTGDTVSYVLDVKCEPTDVVPGVMPPVDHDGFLYDAIDAIQDIELSIGSGVSKTWDVFFKVIKIVLAVIITLVALKLITALVRLIKELFHRRT